MEDLHNPLQLDNDQGDMDHDEPLSAILHKLAFDTILEPGIKYRMA